jgi:hypothetical protein
VHYDNVCVKKEEYTSTFDIGFVMINFNINQKKNKNKNTLIFCSMTISRMEGFGMYDDENNSESINNTPEKKKELKTLKSQLIAEANLLKVRQAMEREELRSKQNINALKMQESMMQLSVEMAQHGETYEDLEGAVSSLNVEIETDDPDITFNIKKTHVPDTVSKSLELLVQSSQLQQKQVLDAIQLPSAQLITFDGDPLQYHMFVTMFESNVNRSTVDNASKLARLMQYCSGSAKQVIMCCAAMKPDELY